MSDSNEEPYATIFASLKHPIRRKILRMLSKNTMSFSEMLEALKVSSSFLTYHLENLGELILKIDDGRYRLSSFGEAALATMTKVEDIPATAHLQFTDPTKAVRRTTAIALGIICIVLVAGLAGGFGYFIMTINDKDNTISSLNTQISSKNSQISQLNSNLTNLQNQLNGLTNGTGIPLDLIVNNFSAWVNKTVLVQGVLIERPFEANLLYVIPSLLWNFWLSSSNGINQIRVRWNGGVPDFSPVQIYGVVRQDTENLNGTNITVFYIEALTIDPTMFYIQATPYGATP